MRPLSLPLVPVQVPPIQVKRENNDERQSFRLPHAKGDSALGDVEDHPLVLRGASLDRSPLALQSGRWCRSGSPIGRGRSIMKTLGKIGWQLWEAILIGAGLGFMVAWAIYAVTS